MAGRLELPVTIPQIAFDAAFLFSGSFAYPCSANARALRFHNGYEIFEK